MLPKLKLSLANRIPLANAAVSVSKANCRRPRADRKWLYRAEVGSRGRRYDLCGQRRHAKRADIESIGIFLAVSSPIDIVARFNPGHYREFVGEDPILHSPRNLGAGREL